MQTIEPTTENITIDLLPKVVTALMEGLPTHAAHRNLTTKYNLSKPEATALIDKANVIIAANKKQAIKDRLQAARQELKSNDDGIDQDAVNALEAKIREILDPADLEPFNDDLSRKGRRLTYTEIAIIAAIHRRSVRENKGDSPFSRIQKLAERSGLIDKPLDNRQIRYALTILEAIGFTYQIGGSTKGSFKDGKYQKGQCGKWSISDDWDD